VKGALRPSNVAEDSYNRL